jgi:hypothetical protein
VTADARLATVAPITAAVDARANCPSRNLMSRAVNVGSLDGVVSAMTTAADIVLDRAGPCQER